MKRKFTKLMAMMLSLIMMFMSFMSLPITANTDPQEINIGLIGYPISGNDARWGHDNLTFMNGWYEDEVVNWNSGSSQRFWAKYASNLENKVAYCVQPGVPLNSGNKSPKAASKDYLDKYSNSALDSYQIQYRLGLILQYGYNEDVTSSLSNEVIAEMIATQLLVWETIVGERNPDFSYKGSTAPNKVTDSIRSNHPLRSDIFTHYYRIASEVQNHDIVPSFMKRDPDKVVPEEMEWDGSKYSYTFHDNNGVLNQFPKDNFKIISPPNSDEDSGAEYSINGDELTITMTNPPEGVIEIRADKSISKTTSVVFWGQERIYNKNTHQGLILGWEIDDPVHAFLKLEVGNGTLEVMKSGEKFSGVTESTVTFGDKEYTLYEPVYSDCPLSGATFDIYTKNGNYYNGKYYEPGTIVTTVTSDAAGNVDVQLRLGDYYAVEVETPYGMAWDETPYYFGLNTIDDPRPLGSLKNGIYNERQTVYISLKKRFDVRVDDPAHNYKPYDYVVFGLFASEVIPPVDGKEGIPVGGLVDWVRLNPDQNGYAQFTTDLPFGEYYVEEIDWSRAYYPLKDDPTLKEEDYPINCIFEYNKNGVREAYIDIGAIVNTLPPGGTLRIEKNFPGISEHATGGGLESQNYNKMSDIGITNGQNWEEYSPINVGEVLDGKFSREIICEMERFEVGTMTAEFSYNNKTNKHDLIIHYELSSGYALQQDARFAIAHHPTCDDKNCGKHFTSKSYGDLFVGEQTYKNGETSGFITVSADTLAYYEIDINKPDQEFYVFLRLSKVVAGTIPDGLKTKGIVSNENRSWIDSGYLYEFMVFDLNDFEPFKGKGKDYADQKAIEKAVKTDVNGILAKGIKPIAHPYCKAWNYVLVDLPTGKYLMAEIFRDADGNIIDNPDYVTINGTVGNVFTINPNKITGTVTIDKATTVNAEVINNFSKFYEDVRPGKIPDPAIVISGTVSTNGDRYSQYKDVNISSTITNYTEYKAAVGYKNIIEIRNSEDDLIVQYTKRLPRILPGGSFTVERIWGTAQYIPGTYTVISNILSSDNMIVYTSKTTIEVEDLKAPALPTLSGGLTPVETNGSVILDEDNNENWNFNASDEVRIRYEFENIQKENTLGNVFTGITVVQISRISENVYSEIYRYVSKPFTLQINGTPKDGTFVIPEERFGVFKPGTYSAKLIGIMENGKQIGIIEKEFKIIDDSAKKVSLTGSISPIGADGNGVQGFNSSDVIRLGFELQNHKDNEVSGNAVIKIYRIGENEEDDLQEIHGDEIKFTIENLSNFIKPIVVPNEKFGDCKPGAYIAVLVAVMPNGSQYGIADCNFKIS